MLVSLGQNPLLPRAQATGAPDPQPPPKDREVKPELEGIADRYNGARATGNYVSGGLLGAVKETVATTVQAPYLAEKIIENLWQAETLGPNLKILGTIAAIPAAVLSIPVSPFYGAVMGMYAVHSSQRGDGRDPLTKDTSSDFARSVFSNNVPAQGEEGEARTMTGRLVASLEELGARKLEPGEKPHDVPILSPLFSVAGGIVSFAISGVVGLVAGLAAGSLTTVKEMAGAFVGDKTVGDRVVQFATSPLNALVMPFALAWSGIKESVPRGFVDGWKHGPFKPIGDTAVVSAKLASGVLQEAWERKIQ